MVRSSDSSVQREELSPPPSSSFSADFCSCGCGARALRLPRRHSPLAICFRSGAGVTELIQLVRLPPVQKLLLHTFHFHERGKGECWLSSLTLMAKSGVNSRQTLSSHKRALQALGVVSWRRPGRDGNAHTCCLYRLYWPALQRRVLEQLARDASAAPACWYPEPVVAGEPAEPQALPCAAQAAEPLPPWPSRSTVGQASPCPAQAAATEERGGETGQASPCPAQVAEPVAAGPLPQAPQAEQGLQLPAPHELAGQLPAAIGPEAEERLAPQTPSHEAGAEAPAQTFSVGVAVPPHEAAADNEELPESDTAQTSAAAGGVEVIDGLDDPRPAFQVSLALVWSCWQQAYQRVYGRLYFLSPSDAPAAASLAQACRAAVLFHAAPEADAACLEALAKQFLLHVSQAFLKLPGRDGFLQRRGHPLPLLVGDLNALGVPWSKRPAAPVAPAKEQPRRPTTEPLPPQQTAERARGLLAALARATPAARPRRPAMAG